MVVYWNFTPLLMLPKSGCAESTAYDKERKKWVNEYHSNSPNFYINLE